MKKIIALTLACLILMSTLTGCEKETETTENVIPPYPVTVDNITINEKPMAVASLSPILTRLLIELGYYQSITGYSNDSFVPSVVEEPLLIGTALKPDMEAIAKAKPEIIFTTLPFTKSQTEKLSSVNIKVIVMPRVTSIEDLKARTKSIVTVMEGQNEADEIAEGFIKELERKIDYIKSQIPKKKKTFLYVCALDPIIATGDTFESDIMSIAGDNLAKNLKNYSVSADELASLDPDVIFYSAPLLPEHISQSELFKDKKAVLEENLIEVDQNALLNQSSNIDVTITNIAKLLYPEIDFTIPKPESPVSETISDGEPQTKE